ncbi:MAG: prolyl oligopeptidase family serine peptidase [Bacteroidales bacterium]|jgi:predicted esterase
MNLACFTKRVFFLALIISLSFRGIFGQSGFLIPYCETPPVIDGIPDEKLNQLKWQEFSYIQKTSEENNDIPVRYKIGYGLNYLYLIIESKSDSIICRDRAYQNGDGFHLVIARPEVDHKSEEFYVLRFSPADTSKKIPARKGVWYYNIDLSGKSLSSATQFVCRSSEGKSYFELMLPWNEIYPYNPLFSDSVGINLCFVKAVGAKEKNYYFLKYDPNIQSELRKREYITVSFQPPSCPVHSCSFAQPEQNNIRSGNNVRLKIVSMSNDVRKITFDISVRSADNNIFTDFTREVLLSGGINRNEFDIPVDRLIPDGYRIVWKCSDNSEGEIPLSILPEINLNDELKTLNDNKMKVSEGDYNSLLFLLQNIMNNYEKIKKYEIAGEIRERYYSYRKDINELANNQSPYSDKRGIFRRAFLSKIDSTLQPYTIKIPDNFDRNKKYPLFVMLHGSGSDDQNMLNDKLTENNFIEIAPFGRGTSNCFTTDGAEIDVKEAIDDVVKNYPVDTSRIVIAGFSMGGYGAYRIFYEYPRLFKGVVVFSGHPSLASKWIGEGFPDFLESKYLLPFRNIPVFIYHSKNDMNCPYDLTLQLVAKLKTAGAEVEFLTASDSGHGLIDKENIQLYYNWLKENIINNTTFKTSNKVVY